MDPMKSKAAVDESRDTNFLNDKTRSAQQQYYEYQLRKEKLKDIAEKGVEDGWLLSQEKDALGEVSDKEKIELKVLARLYGLTDTSAEYLQVKTITGCDSREEVAAKLADIYYKKYVTDSIIAKFISPNTTKTSILEGSAKKQGTYWAAFSAQK